MLRDVPLVEPLELARFMGRRSWWSHLHRLLWRPDAYRPWTHTGGYICVATRGAQVMNKITNLLLGSFAVVAAATVVSAPAVAQQQQKPNIIVIWGDDIGIHTPNRNTQFST